jgi:hypothetical protein
LVRRHVIWIITFAGGLFFLLEFLLPASPQAGQAGTGNFLSPLMGGVTNFLVVVGAMALLLGPINLLRSNLATLVSRRKGWLESLTFLAFFVAGILAMALKTKDGHGAMDTLHNWMFNGLMTAFGSTSMALLAFYLVSAAHRALRMNTLEAALMLGAGTIILLGQTPVGDWLTSGLPQALTLDAWTQWILSVPNAGVQRGVVIGACGGAFAAGLRQWLSLGRKAE